MLKLIKITLTIAVISINHGYSTGVTSELAKSHDETSNSINPNGPSTKLQENETSSSLQQQASIQPIITNDEDTYQGGLPDLQVGRDMYTSEQMDVVYDFFLDLNKFHGKYTITEFGLAALTSRSHTMVFNDMLTHRYDSFKELKQSTRSGIDNEACLQQLAHINERMDLLNKHKLDSTDINLYHLLDTYGRVPPGMVSGSALWAGMYHDCLSLKFNTPQGNMSTRYCLGSLRQHHWPRSKPFDELIALKVGLCLPQACDSLRYKNKYELIHRLLEFNAREVDLNQSTLDGLYCLPDEDSPIRMWWNSPRSLQAVLLLSGWIGLLIFATIKYERSKVVKPSSSLDSVGGADATTATSGSQGKFGLTNGFKLGTAKAADSKTSGAGAGTETGDAVAQPDAYFKIYQMLAITNNLKLLFDTTKASALLETGDKLKKSSGASDSDSQERNLASSQQQHNQLVDLRCLEGIKVICMSYVIMGHVLMCLTSLINNGREMTASISPAFFLANLMPAFAVNSFFTITGILTCYLLFKQNQSHSFLTNPLKWLAFILYRYLRIMPMYVVVVYYCKYLGKFAGSGPMWDYGTSSLATRRRCEDESWLWTLMFGANFKPPLDHCIPSAWYLANDFQFFMVTPIFLALLHKSPAMGQRLLKFSILAGYLAGIASIVGTEIADARPIANFMPHGFKTYVNFLSPSYTRPQYRIPAYLLGLLFGYKLHIYEQDKLRHLQQASKKTNHQEREKAEMEEPDWPSWFRKYGMKLSVLSVFFCALAPVLGAQLPFSKFYAKLAVGVFMSSYHIMFALAVGFYILLATTGHGNQFINDCLSASFWKPLARLSLCVVLINIEVTNYIIQTHKQQVYIDFFAQSGLNLLAMVATYLGAIVLCVMFEAPIRAALNQLLAYVIGKLAAKQKLH